LCYCIAVGGTTRCFDGSFPDEGRGAKQGNMTGKVRKMCCRTVPSAAAVLTAVLLARSGAAIAGNPLPLHDGFYLDADVPCREAYTAAMLQIMGDRFESGNNLCTIKSVSHEGRSFTVTDECQETSTGAKSAGTLTMVIPDNHTVVFGPEDDPMKYRYCPISSLPATFKDSQETVPDTPPFQ
jgi:hypothetical protein